MRPDRYGDSRGRAATAVLLAALAVAALPAAFGATATAADAPGSATYLDQCATIDDPGVYVLRSDVVGTDGDCLRVTADDVTLLGAGHVVAADNATGAAVAADGVSDLHVEGIAAEGWWRGVRLTNVEDARVTDVRVGNATADGVRVADSDGVEVDNGSVAGADGHGVVVAASEDVTVASMRLRDNDGDGVAVRDSRAITVRENAVRDNGGVGVRVGPVSQRRSLDADARRWVRPLLGDVGFDALSNLFGAAEAPADPIVVSENRIEDNRYLGVSVVGANDSVVEGNRIVGATDGIKLVDVSGADVSDNEVSGSVDDGIALARTSDTDVDGNRLVDNADDGVYVHGDGNTLVDNTVERNADDGFDLDNSSDTRVESNRAANNGDDGLFLREADSGVVAGNELANNADDGLDIRESTANSIHNNTACGNDHRNVHVRTGVSGNDLADNDAAC